MAKKSTPVVDENVEEQVKTEKPKKVSIAAIVKPSLLNVRTLPSRDSEVIKIIEGGTSVIITGALTDGFYPIDAPNDIKGFVAAEFVDIV